MIETKWEEILGNLRKDTYYGMVAVDKIEGINSEGQKALGTLIFFPYLNTKHLGVVK